MLNWTLDDADKILIPFTDSCILFFIRTGSLRKLKINEKGTKTKTFLELDFLELIHYIVDLIALLIFSVVNTERKSKHRW